MKTNRLGITSGDGYLSLGYRVDVDVCDGLSGICEMSDWMSEEERDGNANLIADAFNTANKCGLLPSELLEQNTKLLDSLKGLVVYCRFNMMTNQLEPLMKKSNEIINQIEQV